MSEPFIVAYVLGVTPTKWVRIWNERMPTHPLQLRQTDDAVADLLTGEADVALLRLPAENDELSAIPLYEETPFVVAPKEHVFESVGSITLADLEGETVLDGQGADTVELVAANVGVALMPQSIARAHSRKDVIGRPITDAAETTIALAWPTAKTTTAVEEFIGIVRGRTVNSSRGATDVPEPAPEPKKGPARTQPSRPKITGRTRPTQGKRSPRKPGRKR